MNYKFFPFFKFSLETRYIVAYNDKVLQIFQKLLAAFDYKVQLIKNCLEINLSMTNVCNTWEEDEEHRMKARVYIWAHSFFFSFS